MIPSHYLRHPVQLMFQRPFVITLLLFLHATQLFAQNTRNQGPDVYLAQSSPDRGPTVYSDMPPSERIRKLELTDTILLDGFEVSKAGVFPGEMNDADQDGVMDINDACPDSPKGYDVNLCGCSAISDPCCLDDDKDQINNCDDECPATPIELAVDALGCPILELSPTYITLNVQFKFNQSTIRPGFFAQLLRIRNFMAQNPEITLDLQAHTDSVGTKAYNQKLSEMRGQSVRDYLLADERIDPSRITVQGFGEIRPIASNKTYGGRAMNRRVMAWISKREMQPIKRATAAK